VLSDPAPSALVRALGENGIELDWVVWIDDPDQGQGLLRSDLLVGLLTAFQANSISVPQAVREMGASSSVAARV
jgi:small-conductance mechanosensitive channel